jgi:spore germination cell wall hydrolase CwlJ-like protein
VPSTAALHPAALHPAERAQARAAARARGARSVEWRLWRQAALIAAPIVACFTALALFVAGDASRAEPIRHLAAAVATPEREAPAAMPATFAEAAPYAAPAQGTTGTIALPPEPAIVPALLGDATVTAAQPFRTAGASATDRGRALECLATAIYYEAASEPDDGQRAVAQVILNRVRHPAFPNTVCGVVYQGSEKASGCQFSYACDGAMARLPSRSGMARATRIAAEALGGHVFAPVGLATHYHTYAVTPAWNRTLVMTDAIGAHFFHRWKGYWGTALAFSQRYHGGEPVPGPHARLAPPAAAPALPPTVMASTAPRTPASVTPPASIQPEHADSGAALASTADSQILDKWKDSGKPIR